MEFWHSGQIVQYGIVQYGIVSRRIVQLRNEAGTISNTAGGTGPTGYAPELFRRQKR